MASTCHCAGRSLTGPCSGEMLLWADGAGFNCKVGVGVLVVCGTRGCFFIAFQLSHRLHLIKDESGTPDLRVGQTGFSSVSSLPLSQPAGRRQRIRPGHLLARVADVEIVERLPRFSLKGEGMLFPALSGLLRAATHLKCSLTTRHHARALG